MRLRRLAPVVMLGSLPLLNRARPCLEQLADRLEAQTTTSAAELAGELWGEEEANSHSAGAKRVRGAARELFPDDAPGHGGEWRLTPTQVVTLREHLREA